MKSIALLCATLFSLNASAATYYVSGSGSTSSNCSQSQPCREIRQALVNVNAGDTILVGNGQYKGFTVNQKSGTASQPITLKATGNNVVITPTSDRPNLENRDNIFITFSDYFIVDGMKTFNAPRSGLRVDTSHHVTVRNSTFGNNGRWGIFTNHCNNILLEENTTYGSQIEHGIYFSNSGDNPTIRYNLIYDNNANGIHMNGDLSAGGATGVPGDGVISGARVEGNVIYNNGSAGGAGINMDGVQHSAIVNNMVYENHATGIVAYQIDGGQGPKNLLIAFNTIDMANDGRYALQLSETTGTITVRNNILATRSSSRGGLAYGLLSDVPNVSSRNNIFAGNPVVAFNDWSIKKTLSQWQSENPNNEVGSFVSNQTSLFVSPNVNLTSRDYHLKGNSPAINQGITVAGVSLDIDKQPRGAQGSPDIGADEISSGSPTPAPPSGNASVVPPLYLLLDDD